MFGGVCGDAARILAEEARAPGPRHGIRLRAFPGMEDKPSETERACSLRFFAVN